MSNILQVARAWKEITIAMKRDSHHSIRAVECLLNTITMMDIDIDVEYSIVILEQLKDCKYDIIHIAESTCFHLLGMMKTA